MNLRNEQRATLARGELVLRVYDLVSYLTLIPDDPERAIYRRRYEYSERAKAERDFDTIRAAAEVWN